jgi:hypothetical protein
MATKLLCRRLLLICDDDPTRLDNAGDMQTQIANPVGRHRTRYDRAFEKKRRSVVKQFDPFWKRKFSQRKRLRELRVRRKASGKPSIRVGEKYHLTSRIKWTQWIDCPDNFVIAQKLCSRSRAKARNHSSGFAKLERDICLMVTLAAINSGVFATLSCCSFQRSISSPLGGSSEELSLRVFE